MSTPPSNAAAISSGTGTKPARLPMEQVHHRMLAELGDALAGDMGDASAMHFRFAELPVCLRATDSDLLWEVSGAFRHLINLEDFDLPAILTIDLWEATETVEPPPPRPFGRENTRYFSYHCDDYDGSMDLEMGQLLVRIRRRSNAFLAHPFRRMMWRWFRGQEIFPLQGAMVAHNDRGLLLLGERGSGRSSAVMECIEADWQFLADSQAGLSRSGNHFTGYSLFSCIEMDPLHAANYKEWQPYGHAAYGDDASGQGNERAVFNVADALPEALQDKVQLCAIVVLIEDPDRGDGPATAKLARRAALSVLAADTRGLDRTTLKTGRDDYLKLAEHCPCYAVVRRSLAEPIVPNLEEILHQLEAQK
jgi:hypothetical protein